jgi:hypothetical protein
MPMFIGEKLMVFEWNTYLAYFQEVTEVKHERHVVCGVGFDVSEKT